MGGRASDAGRPTIHNRRGRDMKSTDYLKLVEAYRQAGQRAPFTTGMVIEWAIAAGVLPPCQPREQKRLADGLHRALTRHRAPDGGRRFLSVDMGRVKDPALRARLRGEGVSR